MNTNRTAINNEIVNEILQMIRSKCALEDTAPTLAINQVFEVLDAFDVKLLQVRLAEAPQMYPVVVQALLKLVKARKTSKNCAPLNHSVKPSPNGPDFVLPEAKRGLTEETLKKITDAIHLFLVATDVRRWIPSPPFSGSQLQCSFT